MKRLVWLLLPLAVACAQVPPTAEGPDTAPPQSGDAYRARIHTELAAQYFARGQHSVAFQEIRQALVSNANYAPAYDVRAMVHAELGEDREAEESFRRAISLDDNYPEARNNFGYFLCQRGRYDEALDQLERAWKNPRYLSPDRALANAGYCALLKGDLGAADHYAQRALARSPSHPVALLTQAEVALRNGSTAFARAQLRQVESRGNLDAAGLWLGVRIERLLGNRNAEVEYGSQLRRRFPNSQEARWLIEGNYDQGGPRR